MNIDNMRTFGIFNKHVEAVKNKKCPFCGKEIKGQEDFIDEISWKEYKISGLCQKCQDETFGKKGK